MARPSKFADEDILAAAEKLVEQGKPVTGYTLSVELDGGRPSSLEDRYRELTTSKEPAPVLPALPADVASAVEQLTSEVAGRLTAVLTSAHASLKAQANARVDEIEQTAEQQRLSAKAELDDAVERIGTEQDRAEQAETALAAANESLQALKVQLSKLEGAATESARQVDALKADLATQSEKLQAALAENAALASKLSQTEEARNAALTLADDANKRREAAEKQAAGAEAKLEQTSVSLKGLQAEQAQMQKQVGSLEAQLAAVVKERDSVSASLADTQKVLSVTQAERDTLKESLAKCANERVVLEDRAVRAVAETEQLRRELRKAQKS